MKTLLYLSALLGLAMSQYSISVDNGLWEGVQGNEEFCQRNVNGNYSRAYALDFKFETTDHADNTAGNSVKLFCGENPGQMTGYITSLEGNYGTWQGIRSCPVGHYIVGFRLRVLEYQGTWGDDWGVDNIQVECSDGTILDGMDGVPPALKDEAPQRDTMTADDMGAKATHGAKSLHGEWGSWARCLNGHSVMGIQTYVEQGHPFEDDAGLSNLNLYCF